MQIQRMELSQAGESAREKLYIRCLQGSYQIAGQSIQIGEKTLIRFDTYFNACPIEKWLFYTTIPDLSFHARIKGSGILRLYCVRGLPDGGCERKLLAERGIKTDDGEQTVEQKLWSKAEGTQLRGVLYAEIETGEAGQCVLSECTYDTSAVPEREVSLTVAICTYRREKYLERNLKLIKEQLWENSTSALCHKIRVIVADNGRTLEEDQNEPWLKICPNKNAGGAAGFARGMLETMREGHATHVLLMDDDVEVKPSALEKTYTLLSLLKEEHTDRMVGGAMLRSDYTFVQQEAGGSYQGGRIRSLHSGLDLREAENVWNNEKDEPADYNAWWYCCIPLSLIKQKGLPLPVFLHCDDVEYGLRSGREPIRMNGICVWHDAFEQKRPSVNEYYDVRNALLVNGLYVAGYGSRQAFSMVFRRTLVNLFRYRYRDIRLVIRAAEDYLRGPQWLMNADAQQLHGELMRAGYRYSEPFCGMLPDRAHTQLADILAGRSNSSNIDKKKLLSLNGWLLPARRGKPVPVMAGESPHCYYRKKKVWIYDPDTQLGFYTGKEARQLFVLLGEWLRLGFRLKKEYATVQKVYRSAFPEMTSVEFWSRYLREKGE